MLHRISIAKLLLATKSIATNPKGFAHASFLQCAASIVSGQDDDLGKINLKNFMEP